MSFEETYVSDKRIDHLPNECLQLLLDYLPFEDLLQNVPLVCHKWFEIQKLVCHRKTSLILYGDPESVIPEPLAKIFCKYIGLTLQQDSTAESFHCKYSIRREGLANRLMLKRKFPNITTLSVIQFRLTPELDALHELLKMWPLTGFRLICYRAKEDMDHVVWNKICKRINRMSELRHLALFSRCAVNEFDSTRIVGLPKIETLHLGGFQVDLTKLEAIQKLSLYHLNTDNWQYQLEQMNANTAKQITDLTIYPANEQLRISFLEPVCAKFTSLRYLHIRTRLPLNELIAPLAKLTELNHLRIWNYQAPWSVVFDIDPVDLTLLPQLPTVETLHLYVRLCNHTQLNWVSQIFPKLKWIKFDRYRTDCVDCSPENKEKCEMLLLKPLKKCAQLRRIYLDRKSLQIENCPLEYLTQYDELSPDEL